MTMEERDLFLDRDRVHYKSSETDPANPNVLLLHGMSFSSSDWDRHALIDRIASFGFNVYAVDYPGFGKTPDVERYSLTLRDNKKCADFVKDFFSALNKQFYCIVGPSMGGYITLSAIVSYPELVERAILIGAAGLDRVRDDLSSVQSRVLIIWGSEDTTIPIENGIEMKRKLSNSEMVVIDHSRHAAYLDKPDEFLSVVGAFLKSR